MVHRRPARRNLSRPMVFATPRYLGDRKMGSRPGLRYYIYGQQDPRRLNHLHHVRRLDRPPFDSGQARSTFYSFCSEESTCPNDVQGWLVLLLHCVRLRRIGRSQRIADIVSPCSFLAHLIATVCNFIQLDFPGLKNASCVGIYDS